METFKYYRDILGIMNDLEALQICNHGKDTVDVLHRAKEIKRNYDIMPLFKERYGEQSLNILSDLIAEIERLREIERRMVGL